MDAGRSEIDEQVGARALALLVAVALALQGYAWLRVEGHALADTVEYLELARELLDEGGLAPHRHQMRGALYPLLLAPLVALADSFGWSGRALFALVQTIQLSAVVGCLWVAVRLGQRLGGRNAALAAGLFVAANPVLLRFGRDPLPETAAAIALAVGLERLLERGSSGRAFAGGLCCGAAALLSYKTLPLAAGLALGLVLVDRRDLRRSGGCALGILAALAAGIVLDRLVYGYAGLSLANYLVYNVGVVLVSLLVKLGWADLASGLVELAMRYWGQVVTVRPEGIAARVENHSSTLWYLVELPRFVVLPALPLFVLGLARGLTRRARAMLPLLASLALFGLVTSHKDSKSFRLWLPTLPLVAAVVGYGAAELERRTNRDRRTRRIATAGVALATVALGAFEFERARPREHGHWWRALEWLEAQRGPGQEPLRVGASGWPLAFRTPDWIELRPFPALFAAPGEDPTRAVEAFLDGLDVMIVCEAVLGGLPEARPLVERRFDHAAAFHRPENSATFGPVHVLFRAGRGGRPARAALDGVDAAREPRARFRLTASDGTERELAILALWVEALDGDGLARVSIDWAIDGPFTGSPGLRLTADAPPPLGFDRALDPALASGRATLDAGARRESFLLPVPHAALAAALPTVRVRPYPVGPGGQAWRSEPVSVALRPDF